MPSGGLQPAPHLLHVGMLQHAPSGHLAFLHRTAEGKFLPFAPYFRRAHAMTVPLSAGRAREVLGNYVDHMGYEMDEVGSYLYGSPYKQNRPGYVLEEFNGHLHVDKSGYWPDL